jgi:autophagy-related protein 9
MNFFLYLIFFLLISFDACAHSFQSTYQSWDLDPLGQKFLSNLRSFKEHYANQGGTHRDNFNSLPHRQRMEGILSYTAVTVSPPVGHNLGSLWLPDSDQKSHPYLLDLYYTSRWDPPSDDPIHHTAPNMPVNDLHVGINEPLYDIEEDPVQPTWPLSDRLVSHLAASTSSEFLKDSVFSNRFRPDNRPEADDWWKRRNTAAVPAQPTTAPYESFLEPPGFGNPHRHPYGDSQHSGEEETDGKEMDKDGLEAGLGLGLGFGGGVAKTTYTELEEHDNLGLAFTDDDTGRGDGSAHRSIGDISGVQRVSLPVRIIPRSNDPV